MFRDRSLFLVLIVVFGVTSARAAGPAKQNVAFFEKRIRPVLVKHCYRCHSKRAKIVRGGLLLDTRAGIRKGGESGAGVVPGKPDASLVIQALRHESFEMPPKGKLPKQVIADFETWVRSGATDPRNGPRNSATSNRLTKDRGRLWAFRLPKQSAVPTVKNRLWPRSEIDQFILARLESKGIVPAGDADRRTLLRRACFDLVGLPPSPEETAAFLRDSSPDAFAKVVDRLLASPAFGERWGRHWLDVVRFAESAGGGRTRIFEDAWRFRDYVIASFNSDKPYDRFLTEQLAGDLLPFTTLAQRADQLTATGFLVLGPTNYELQDKELLRMEVVDEQIETLGRAFLGMTIGCARCHDHKFDPIPTADYYALAGIFRSTKTLTPGNVSGFVQREIPRDPVTLARRTESKRQIDRLQKMIAQLRRELRTSAQRLWGRGNWSEPFDLPGTVIDDAQARRTGLWKSSTSVQKFLGKGYLHDGGTGDGTRSVEFNVPIPRDGIYEVRLSYAAGRNRATNALATVQFAGGRKSLRINQRRKPPIDGLFVSLGRYRFESARPARVRLSNQGADGHVIADAVQCVAAHILDDKGIIRTERRLDRAKADLKHLRKGAAPVVALAMAVKDETETGDYFICVRGNVHKLGRKVRRGFLSAAGAVTPPRIAPGQSGRRELAAWVTSRRNPLTARVMVNRLWYHLFGAGLARTVDNFGSTGEMPSHPRLLDWLAIRFADDGWSIKRSIRRMMLSRVYQLSSRPAPAARRRDPENRLLSRANLRRLDAECIRDAILSLSGRLDRRMGGSTIHPGTKTEIGYRFKGTRRSVYVPVFRNAMNELFTVFDVADPNLVSGRRTVSTLPTQALYLMNSPFIMDQSRLAASRLLSVTRLDDSARVDRLYRQAMGRLPSERERQTALRYVRSFQSSSAGTSAHDRQLLAWSTLIQTLIGSIDFRFVR